MVIETCAFCVQPEPCSCSPSVDELLYLGMEEWQVAALKRLPPGVQWEGKSIFLRSLMSNDSTDPLGF